MTLGVDGVAADAEDSTGGQLDEVVLVAGVAAVVGSDVFAPGLAPIVRFQIAAAAVALPLPASQKRKNQSAILELADLAIVNGKDPS